MPLHYDTNDVPPSQRSQRWHEVIAATYFPLNLAFRDETASANGSSS